MLNNKKCKSPFKVCCAEIEFGARLVPGCTVATTLKVDGYIVMKTGGEALVLLHFHTDTHQLLGLRWLLRYHHPVISLLQQNIALPLCCDINDNCSDS